MPGFPKWATVMLNVSLVSLLYSFYVTWCKKRALLAHFVVLHCMDELFLSFVNLLCITYNMKYITF